MWTVFFATMVVASLDEAAFGVSASEAEIDGEALGAELTVSPGARQRRVRGPQRRGVHEMRDPHGWPAEPPSPEGALDGTRFDAAFAELCWPVAGGRRDLLEVARLVREASRAAGEDPFLVAALIYRQSRCRADQHGEAGIGLLQIQPQMFAADARLPFDRALLDDRLLEPAHNLQLGIALLQMFGKEHEQLDRTIPQVAHRSGVAHFLWGDRVWAASGEDRVFTARRRLLQLYDGAPPPVRLSDLGVDLMSPLDGTPRLATSGPGVDRAGGKRTHRGLDIDAAVGEPVRAIADGVVQFAGVDRPGLRPALAVSSSAAERVPARMMGPGGLFVRIVHADGLRSGYFHLASYNVLPGETVRAGAVIGTVGLSGVKYSSSHLHFELDRNGELIDPAVALGTFVIPPEETLSHQVAVELRKARLERDRRRRRWVVGRRKLTSEAVPTRPAPGKSRPFTKA